MRTPHWTRRIRPTSWRHVFNVPAISGSLKTCRHRHRPPTSTQDESGLSRQRWSAFTLIELLVAITIIGVLISLLLPAVQRVREAANRTQCANNLKQLALAAHHHHDAKAKFPNGLHTVETTGGGYANATCWEVELLPYVEQDNLKNRWDYNDFRNNVAGGRTATTAQVVEVL